MVESEITHSHILNISLFFSVHTLKRGAIWNSSLRIQLQLSNFSQMPKWGEANLMRSHCWRKWHVKLSPCSGAGDYTVILPKGLPEFTSTHSAVTGAQGKLHMPPVEGDTEPASIRFSWMTVHAMPLMRMCQGKYPRSPVLAPKNVSLLLFLCATEPPLC